MTKSPEAFERETIEKVVSVYNNTTSISKTALQTEISTTKVRKILITEQLWSSPRSQQIRALAELGKSSSEISEDLKISVAMVQNYLPYEKGLYDEVKKSDTAIRSEKYRDRNRKYAKKTHSREQESLEGVNTEQEVTTAKEKKPYFAMQLHLELQNSQIDKMNTIDAKILAKYGGVVHSISRDVIVPSSLALHQLHFLINMAFGWTNSHLHNFQLPQPLFQALTKGTLLEIAPVFGYYLHFPNSTFDDEFWDDDYDETKSPRTWMRSKYLKRYSYKGYSDYWVENQSEIQDVANHRPILDVSVFQWEKKEESKKVKFEEATLEELLNAVIFDTGVPDVLKESLQLSDILSLTPIDIESARDVALEQDTATVQLYKHYRDIVVLEANREKEARDRVALLNAFKHMKIYQKKAEPNDIMPIATNLLYSYDYGDGWKVDISLVQEFGKDTHVVDDETAHKVIESRKPICIAKDGLNVLDDCGNISGYIDMLRTIHEGERREAKELKEWARSQGWTGRDVSPLHLL